jgi:hypothetical protein
MRKMEEIQKDFDRLCGAAGNLQYNIAAQEAHLVEINSMLSKLNEEAKEIRKVAAEEERKKNEEAATIGKVVTGFAGRKKKK